VDDVRRAAENATPSHGNRAGYAEWIALGAVVAGSVGAIIGATRCSQRARHDHFTAARPESASLTAPHGDKLGAAL
jgi:hypothetical protein